MHGSGKELVLDRISVGELGYLFSFGLPRSAGLLPAIPPRHRFAELLIPVLRTCVIQSRRSLDELYSRVYIDSVQLL